MKIFLLLNEKNRKIQFLIFVQLANKRENTLVIRRKRFGENGSYYESSPSVLFCSIKSAFIGTPGINQ